MGSAQPKRSSGNPHARAEAALRKQGLAYPETREDFPWGHCALKVKGKAFAFLYRDKDCFTVSMKLPASRDFALMQPFASPTGYGLGKSGWVTAEFTGRAKVPVALLGLWLEESYLAIAPKKVAALLAGAQRAKAKPARG